MHCRLLVASEQAAKIDRCSSVRIRRYLTWHPVAFGHECAGSGWNFWHSDSRSGRLYSWGSAVWWNKKQADFLASLAV